MALRIWWDKTQGRPDTSVFRIESPLDRATGSTATEQAHPLDQRAGEKTQVTSVPIHQVVWAKCPCFRSRQQVSPTPRPALRPSMLLTRECNVSIPHLPGTSHIPDLTVAAAQHSRPPCVCHTLNATSTLAITVSQPCPCTCKLSVHTL